MADWTHPCCGRSAIDGCECADRAEYEASKQASDGDLPRCYNCLGPAAEEDGLCRGCFNEINGHFGVGA